MFTSDFLLMNGKEPLDLSYAEKERLKMLYVDSMMAEVKKFSSSLSNNLMKLATDMKPQN